MTIEIPGEFQDVLANAVASGAFPNTQDALRHALELLAKEQRSPLGDNGANPSDQEDWAKQFRAWAANHPKVDVVVDDSRESIYEGRGL